MPSRQLTKKCLLRLSKLRLLLKYKMLKISINMLIYTWLKLILFFIRKLIDKKKRKKEFSSSNPQRPLKIVANCFNSDQITDFGGSCDFSSISRANN